MEAILLAPQAGMDAGFYIGLIQSKIIDKSYKRMKRKTYSMQFLIL